MAKTKISEFSSTPGNNTDIDSINIAEGCAPSGINNAIRELMAQLKDFQTGAVGDSFNGPIGTTTAAAGAFTTLTTSGAVTHNAGTANGVAFLNGSKVLTSGSALTFDGTNLGVGTSSAAAPLQIGDGTQTAREVRTSTLAGAGQGGFLRGFRGGNASFYVGDSAPISGSSAGGMTLFTYGATSVDTYTNGILRSTLDSSGNLGLGVTPSAWFSTSRVLQVGSGGAIESRTNFNPYISTTSNAYLDTAGTYRYIGSAEAGRYLQDSGTHKFFTAPSGTAGNAISFNQAMTLDASGNLTVVGDIELAADSKGLILSKINVGPKSAIRAVNGDLRINDSSAGFNSVQLWTNGSESARITSGGDLLVGTTTSGGYRFQVSSNGVTPVYVNRASNTGGLIDFANGSGILGNITTNSFSISYNTTSDYRLKTVIGPVANAGQRIDALQPVEYTWNVSGERTRGFLAHQFREVYAGSVSGTKDAVDAEGKPVYQSMQASSSEVIADLVAELQSLRARVAALESI